MLIRKILSNSNLVRKTDYKTKAEKFENKILDFNVLVSNNTLKSKDTDAEIKILDTSGLVKKADYYTKITGIKATLNAKIEILKKKYLKVLTLKFCFNTKKNLLLDVKCNKCSHSS